MKRKYNMFDPFTAIDKQDYLHLVGEKQKRTKDIRVLKEAAQTLAMKITESFIPVLQKLTVHGLSVDPARSSDLKRYLQPIKNNTVSSIDICVDKEDINISVEIENKKEKPLTSNNNAYWSANDNSSNHGGEISCNVQVQQNGEMNIQVQQKEEIEIQGKPIDRLLELGWQANWEKRWDRKKLESDNVNFSDDDNCDDGLKDLWQDMEFYLIDMKENCETDIVPKETEECNHVFYFKDNVGVVCSLCGLVEQEASRIYDWSWRYGSKKRKRLQAFLNKETTQDIQLLQICESIEENPMYLMNLSLSLHEAYREKMREHQVDGFYFLQRNLVQDSPTGCILAHAPGTGKSFLVIAFLQSFQSAFPEEKPVIVAPKGMLNVWMDEFLKWKVDDIKLFNFNEAEKSAWQPSQVEEHDLKLPSRCWSQLRMLRQWKAQKSVLLISYHKFSRVVCSRKTPIEIKNILLNSPGIVILDEGHISRTKDSKIRESLLQLHTKRRVILSGTLFQNNFRELYELYQLVRPDFMASNVSRLKEIIPNSLFMNSRYGTRHCESTKIESMGWKLFKELGNAIKSGDGQMRRRAVSYLAQLSQSLVHWYKGGVLQELPGLIDLTVTLKITEIQKQALSLVEKNWLKGSTLGKVIKAGLVSVHPSLVTSESKTLVFHERKFIDPSDSAKTKFVLDLLRLCLPLKEKILIFAQNLSPFTFMETVLARNLGWNLNREMLHIIGEMDADLRYNAIKRFNEDPKAKILFASIKTCGEGVSLIGASRVVFLDVNWNPAVTRQAVSRAFRIGQKKKVYVYRLVGAGTIDEVKFLRACKKEWIAKQIFEDNEDQDFEKFINEIDPRVVDPLFESPELRKNVEKCFRFSSV